MKLKWVQPFFPTLVLAFPGPSDLALRVVNVVGVLICVGVYLAISRPWQPDDQVKS